MSQTGYIPLQSDDTMDQRQLSQIYNSSTESIGARTKFASPKLTNLQLWRLSLVNMYVTDALNTRPPNKILQVRCPKPGLWGVSVHTAYKMSHNSFWSLFVYISIWIHLSMIIYEPWANIDMKTKQYPIYVYILEIFVLFIYSIDVYLHKISHDPDNYWDLSWAKIIVVCIVLNYIDIFAAIIFNAFIIDGFLLRVGAILRPIFLITRSQFLRATCLSIFNAFSNVLDVLLLVCLYILMFAVLGYVLFSEQQLGIGVHVSSPNSICDEQAAAGGAYDTDCNLIQDAGNVNFETLFDSYLSLCVLMSTANYPDVMMPSFHANKASALFFVAFIGFGIYYLMSIIFAVIYHHYHCDNIHFVRKITNNRARALDEAWQQMIIFSKELELPSYQLQEDKVAAIDFNKEKIYFSLFQTFLKFRRNRIGDQKTRILYNAMCEARRRTDAVKLHEDEGIGISREQWQHLYQFVNVEIFRDPSYAVEFMIKQGKDKVMFSLVLGDENMYSMDDGCCSKLFLTQNNVGRVVGDRRQCQCCFLMTQKVYFAWLHFRGFLYKMFTHSIVSKIIDLLVWLGTLMLIYEIQLKSYNKHLETMTNVCIYIFVVEVTLRFVAFGKYFFKDGFNVLDFIVVYASLFIDVFDPFTSEHLNGYLSHPNTTGNRSNGLVAFRLLRIVRALGTIPRFKLIISTSVTVIKKVGVLFSLEFCVFYFFSIIGVFCYGGMVNKESSLAMLYAARLDKNVDDISFWEYVRDNYYYDNNMNYITNTLMVMVELTVVNQWHMMTRMYTELSSPWAYLYFYSFYFVSVLIVTNVLTAFIFDAFIIQFQHARMEQEELDRKHSRQADVDKQHKLAKDQQIYEQTMENQKRFKARNTMGEEIELRELPSKDDPNHASVIGDKTDMLDEYIHEINASDKDEWHKWVAIAMLYEFNTDDVIRGVWLYDRKKTTADFYEKIYGEVSVPFEEYLKAWKGHSDSTSAEFEEEQKEYDSEDFNNSMNGVVADSEVNEIDSNQSLGDSELTFNSSKQDSIRGSGKDIFITRTAIKQRSILSGDLKATSKSMKDNEGNIINKVQIKGPKQSSIFKSLSMAPQVGYTPFGGHTPFGGPVNKKKQKQLSKASKLIDVYIPQSPH